MKKIAGIICIILLYTISLQAQTRAGISGHILDEETGEHLPYVNVMLKGTTTGTVADETGHFYLKNLPTGQSTISLSFMGYQDTEIDVELVAGKTLNLDLKLEKNKLQLDRVVVSANRNETDKRKSSIIVNVLNTKLFETTNSCNLAQGLNYQTGLRVENNCQNCGFPQLRINGLDGQYSQILIDSRPIFSSLAGVYGLEQIPTNMIERVEIIRGSGSALFGSNAIAGIVNIITKEPKKNMVSIGNSTTIIGMNTADINTSLNASLVSTDQKAGIYIFGANKQRSPYDNDGDGFSEIGKLSSEILGFRGYYKLSGNSKITAEYHHMHEFRRGGNKFDLPPHQADIAEQTDYVTDGGGLKYDLFSKSLRHRLSVFGSMQNINRNSYYGAGEDPFAYGKTTDLTYIVGSQYVYMMKKFLFMPADLTAGIEYNEDKLHDEMLGYFRNIRQTTQVASAFVQNEWKKEDLSILVGARLDKHNLIENLIFSPRGSVRYNFTEDISLRANYASGFRAPQAFDEDLHVTAVGGDVSIIRLDPDLKPEYSNSFSGSLDLYRNFGKTQTNFLVEGFYTRLKDVFMLQELGKDFQGNIEMLRVNGPGAVVGGINLEAKVVFPIDLQLQVGYTWQRSMYEDTVRWSDNPDLAPQKRMFRSPDQYGFLTVSYVPWKKLTLACSGTYTGSMLVQHFAGYIPEDAEVNTPDFFDMNFKVSYAFSLSSQVKLTADIGIQNIFNSYQSDFDQGKDRDAGYIYGPAYPRSLTFGVKCSF